MQSRDWTESNVEDIVRTGDHCCLRISKQMTPYKIRYESALGGSCCRTFLLNNMILRIAFYRLGADVRMVHLGVKLDLWRLEWIVYPEWYINSVNLKVFLRAKHPEVICRFQVKCPYCQRVRYQPGRRRLRRVFQVALLNATPIQCVAPRCILAAYSPVSL